MKHTKILKSALALGITAALSASASAAIITTSDSFSGFASGQFILDLDKFDTSLGTLTGVNIQIDVASDEGFAQADNEDVGATGEITITNEITGTLISDGDAQLLVDGSFSVAWFGSTNLLIEDSATATLGADDGDGVGVQDSGLDYFAFNPAAGIDTVNADINSAVIAGYEGASGEKLTLEYDSTQLVETSAVGAVSTSTSPSALNGTVTVTYTYTEPVVTAVPEPSSAALLGLGGLGLLLRRRRA